MHQGSHEGWPGGQIIIVCLICLAAAAVGGWLHGEKAAEANRNEAIDVARKKLAGHRVDFDKKWVKAVDDSLESIGPGLMRRPKPRLGEIGEFSIPEVLALFLAGKTEGWQEQLGRTGEQLVNRLLAVDELPAVGADYGVVVDVAGPLAFRSSKATSTGLKTAQEEVKKLSKDSKMAQRWASADKGAVDLVVDIPVVLEENVHGLLLVGKRVSDELLSKAYPDHPAALLHGGRLVASNGPVCVEALVGVGGLESFAEKDVVGESEANDVVFVTGKTTTDKKHPPMLFALCEKLTPPEGGWSGQLSRYYWYGGGVLAIILSALLAIRAHRKVDQAVAEEEADSLGGWGD